MSSNQELSPILYIHTPRVTASPSRMTPSPDPQGRRKIIPQTPARSASGGSTSTSSLTPLPVLRTPPVGEPRSPPRSTADCFSLRSARSTSRYTRRNSHSDNVSLSTPCISPCLSTGSFHSSDTGHSASSSDFLTPPLFQADADNPPYKPRRQSDECLSMMRRSRAMAHEKFRKTRRRHARKHKCRHKKVSLDEPQNRPHWWLSGCQIAPTAPASLIDPREGHTRRHRPRNIPFGNTDTSGQVIDGLRVTPAPPLVTRRWSSVEIGTHQTHPPSAMTKGSPASAPEPGAHGNSPRINPAPLSQCHRSSTFTCGVRDHDIVLAIREKLTTRKLPSTQLQTQLQTPATITLRRASSTGGVTEITEINPATAMMSPDALSGGTTPLANPCFQFHHRRPPATYLITSSDIDSITELIEANIRRKFQSQSRVDLPPPSLTPPTPYGTRIPTVTTKGLVPITSSPAESAVTVAEVQRSCSKPQDPLNYLQVSPAHRTKKTISRKYSQKSMHEVIWEGSLSPQNTGSMTEQECFKSPSRSNCSSQPGTPRTPDSTACPNPSTASRSTLLPMDKGVPFDPCNARDSISEWSWRCPRGEDAEISVVVTSDSESNEMTPSVQTPPTARPTISDPQVQASPKTKPSPRSVILDTQLSDVVSFPPLPARRTTSDWYSPLPDIETPLPLSERRSLYDIGIDVTCSPPSSKPTILTVDQNPWVRSAQVLSPEPSRAPTRSIRSDYEIRRKSVIRTHPKAPARVGESSAMGSSVGASSRERRRSSTKSLKGIRHVRTIDNKPERPGTWIKRRPPSICPPPKTPSPSEMDDDEEGWLGGLRVGGSGPGTRGLSISGMKSRLADRMSLITARSPPLPKADHAGIYGRITGTSKNGKDAGDDCKEKDGCTPHVCDDCKNDPRNPSVDWIG
jgi:hypothetical protein